MSFDPQRDAAPLPPSSEPGAPSADAQAAQPLLALPTIATLPDRLRLILASASPRRQSLLAEAGYAFIIEPSNVDEEAAPPMPLPAEMAMQLAVAKADAVAARYPDDVVLGADTVVAFGDQMLGKPRDAEHARQMLTLLAGTTHIVITAVAVVHGSANFHAIARVMSAVHMRPISKTQIDRYVASNGWEGKAGGYGIQDNDPFVERLAGCHTNIVGLPMKTTRRILSQAGIEPKT